MGGRWLAFRMLLNASAKMAVSFQDIKHYLKIRRM
jgi:hypothetical protein